MPLRVGKYRPGETEDNIAILKAAVANLGSDAAAVIPEGMLIEFVDGVKSQGGESLFERVANFFDKQMSKAILGQTMTADDGSSQSQATVHNEVREDLRDADAEQLAETLLRDLVIPYITLNRGPRENYPQLFLREPDQTDIPVMAEALAKLVPLGLRVEVSEVRDRLGFSDPAKGAECLGQIPQQVGANGIRPVSAINRQQIIADPAEPAAQVALYEAMVKSGECLKSGECHSPLLDAAEKLLGQVNSIDEFQDRLIELYSQSAPDRLAVVMAQMSLLSNAAGRASVGES